MRAGRRLNAREMSVLKQEASKKRVHGKAFLVDVSQSHQFARSGVAESPTWARSTKMAAVMPHKPLASAQLMSADMGLVPWQTYSCPQMFKCVCAQQWQCVQQTFWKFSSLHAIAACPGEALHGFKDMKVPADVSGRDLFSLVGNTQHVRSAAAAICMAACLASSNQAQPQMVHKDAAQCCRAIWCLV